MGNFFKDIGGFVEDVVKTGVKYNPFTLPIALYEDQRKSASHKMADITNQMSAAMASMPSGPGQYANYSIIAALLKSKRSAASRQAQGIFTSPLGLGNISGSTAGKKMLLGQ